jgi:hypothetical protein
METEDVEIRFVSVDSLLLASTFPCLLRKQVVTWLLNPGHIASFPVWGWIGANRHAGAGLGSMDCSVQWAARTSKAPRAEHKKVAASPAD